MLRACGNREDAEDVLIEALLKAYEHMHQLNDPAAFRAWLAQIGRRVCWQLKEREALLPLLQLSMLEEEGAAIKDPKPPVDSELALRRMKELLENAVNQLPPSAREVFVLRDMEELPGEEVARRLGISLASMKSRCIEPENSCASVWTPRSLEMLKKRNRNHRRYLWKSR